MSAREEVLARIREAVGAGERPPLEVDRAYRHAGVGTPGADELVALLVERLADYKAGVRVTHAEELPGAVAAAVADGLGRRAAPPPQGPPRVLIPSGLDIGCLAALRADVTLDDQLDAATLDTFDAVVTTCTVAIARTGTLVLDGGPGQGRRALTLVPDVHVCVVRREQIVLDVPDAIARLDPARPLTWISGPSATSDIELERVEGVHGPRNLEVVVT